MWLDDCRIPFVDGNENTIRKTTRCGLFNMTDIDERINGNTQGRFTPNLLVCDDMLNDGVISKSGSNRKNKEYKPLNSQLVKMGGGDKNYEPNDKGTNSRYYDLDKWFDKIIDSL